MYAWKRVETYTPAAGKRMALVHHFTKAGYTEADAKDPRQESFTPPKGMTYSEALTVFASARAKGLIGSPLSTMDGGAA